MNEATDNLHDDILDWSLRYPFEELNKVQQQFVLKSISTEEYNDLHRVSIQLKKVTIDSFDDDNIVGKNKLLAHFELVRKAKGHIRLHPKFYWKAAALILLFISIGLTTALYHDSHFSTSLMNKASDTVFLVRNIEAPVKIVRDTVFLKESRKQVFNSKSGKQKSNLKNTMEFATGHTPTNDDIHVVRLHELKNRINAVNGYSIGEDSLVREYKFVSL